MQLPWKQTIISSDKLLYITYTSTHEESLRTLLSDMLRGARKADPAASVIRVGCEREALSVV